MDTVYICVYIDELPGRKFNNSCDEIFLTYVQYNFTIMLFLNHKICMNTRVKENLCLIYNLYIIYTYMRICVWVGEIYIISF